MKSIATQWKNEGRQEGAYESKVQIAKAMLKEKQDLSFIAKVTGLSVKEVIALKDK